MCSYPQNIYLLLILCYVAAICCYVATYCDALDSKEARSFQKHLYYQHILEKDFKEIVRIKIQYLEIKKHISYYLVITNYYFTTLGQQSIYLLFWEYKVDTTLFSDAKMT